MVLPRRSSIDLPVRASASVSRTVPVCCTSDWFDTLTVNSITSPSRKNRGGLGWTIRSLAVTTLSWREPLRRALSWAKPRNFHWVRASGMVNSSLTLPSASAIRCGKKKAVSLRFLRAETLLRSGAWRHRLWPHLASRHSPGDLRLPTFTCIEVKTCYAVLHHHGPFGRRHWSRRGRLGHRSPKGPWALPRGSIPTITSSEELVAPQVGGDLGREGTIGHDDVLVINMPVALEMLQVLQAVLELHVGHGVILAEDVEALHPVVRA